MTDTTYHGDRTPKALGMMSTCVSEARLSLDALAKIHPEIAALPLFQRALREVVTGEEIWDDYMKGTDDNTAT